MELRIEKLVYGGDGIGRKDGIVWFVPYSAPGDLIRIRERERAKNYRRGEIVALIEPGPGRTRPRCPWFGRCGGCQWQHIDYDLQLESKDGILAESISRALGADIRTAEAVPSPSAYEYRRRITLHAAEGGIGYHAAGSNELVPVDDCPIAHPALRRWLADPPLAAEERTALPERFELRVNDAGKVERITDPAAAGFVQANADGNSVLRSLVARLVTERIGEARIVDLFCGDGNLSRGLAETARSITGWDSSRAAIDRARSAAAGMPNLSYRCAPVARIRRELASRAGATDLILLDPPRQGIRRDADFIASLSVPWVLYVSCNPTTLTRDCRRFLKSGYRIEHLQAVDMFPQTYHLESLLLLRRER